MNNYSHPRTKQDICHDCNIYHISCMGELFERPKKKVVGAISQRECISQVKSPDNTQSKIQVAAFGSLYRAKRKFGMDKFQAFAEAVVHTSDEVFAEAKLKRPHLIRQWKK